MYIFGRCLEIDIKLQSSAANTV